MPDVKTKPNDESVEQFLSTVADPGRRDDCFTLLDLMRGVTGEEARMWGPSIVGFGTYHYTYESGREGGTFLVGFSPRRQNLTLYITAGLERYSVLLTALGAHTMGKGCLYIKRIKDIDLATLRSLLQQSLHDLKESSAR